MFTVLSLSENTEQLANMVRGFLNDTIIINPLFPKPDINNKSEKKVYKKYVTREEKRTFVIRCGINEYFYRVPDNKFDEIYEFHKEMLRERAHKYLDTFPYPIWMLKIGN